MCNPGTELHTNQLCFCTACGLDIRADKKRVYSQNKLKQCWGAVSIGMLGGDHSMIL